MKFRYAELSDIKQMQVVRNLVKENRLRDPGLVTDEESFRAGPLLEPIQMERSSLN